jgi:hypothetical protein
VLTDSEVDRRFFQMVAELNSATLTVDWAWVSDPAEQLPPEPETPATPHPRTGALRLVAVISIVVTIAAGVAMARAWALGLSFLALWLILAVPGIALAVLVAVDRLRRRNRHLRH